MKKVSTKLKRKLKMKKIKSVSSEDLEYHHKSLNNLSAQIIDDKQIKLLFLHHLLKKEKK